jgi:hypothetical protein
LVGRGTLKGIWIILSRKRLPGETTSGASRRIRSVSSLYLTSMLVATVFMSMPSTKTQPTLSRKRLMASMMLTAWRGVQRSRSSMKTTSLRGCQKNERRAAMSTILPKSSSNVPMKPTLCL